MFVVFGILTLSCGCLLWILVALVFGLVICLFFG